MKKLLLIIWIAGVSTCLKGQVTWQYGTELNLNSDFTTAHQRGGLYSINLFGIYKKHELYSGVDVNRIQRSIKRIFGFEAGYKYHSYQPDKKSHFYVELNYQYGRHADGCAGSVHYNFVPEHPSDGCLAFRRYKTNMFSVMIGYEMFCAKWLSVSYSSGLGNSWVQASDPGFDVEKYLNRRPVGVDRSSLPHLLVKFSLRFTLSKKAKDKTPEP